MTIRFKQVVWARIAACAMLLSVACAEAAGGAGGVTIVPVPDGGEPVAAKIDAQGTIHLVWNSANGPQYASSTDDGKTWSTAIPVVRGAAERPGLEYFAVDLAVSPEGRVHVAMGSNAWKLKLPEEEWGFYYARLDPGVDAFTPMRNINRKPSEGFSLATDDKGRVTACWLSGKLYANVSHDDGETFGPNVQINPALDPCDCCTTSAAYGLDGKLAVLYREETNNDRDMFLVLWDQERNGTSQTRVSSTLWKVDACPMSYYSVARDGDGFVAVWPTKGQIYFARLGGQGNPESPAEIKTPGSAGMRTGMLALCGPDGSTLVAWKEDGQLRWQLHDRLGLPSGPPASATSGGDGVAGIVSQNGQFVLFR